MLENSGKYTEKDIKSFDVVQCKVNDQLVLAVSKKYLQQACGDSEIKGFLRYLANQKILLTQPDSSGNLKYTRQIRYKVKGAKFSGPIERRYCFINK